MPALTKALQTACNAEFAAIFAAVQAAQDAHYAGPDSFALDGDMNGKEEIIDGKTGTVLVVSKDAAEREKPRGRYAQLLPTHAGVPADGVALAPDALALKAGSVTGRADDPAWSAAGVALPAKTICSYRVDTFDGPEGKGWSLAAETVEGGVTYRRVQVWGGAQGMGTAGWTPLAEKQP